MVDLMALWLPILLSAVFVFIASSIIHMLLPYHKGDYGKLPEEEKLLEAMRQAGVSRGDYAFPCPDSPSEMHSPEMQEKYNKGPVGFMSVLPSGGFGMRKALTLWFIYSLVIGVFAAYLAGRTLPPGAEYLAVFRVAGTAAVLGYGAAHAHDSIWGGRQWSATFKHTFDAVIYGLLTAGTFGWLWPD